MGLLAAYSNRICYFQQQQQQTALLFSTDFDKIFKIAFLHIKDGTYSFLSWLGDFTGFWGPNQRFFAISGSLAQ